MNRWSVFSTFVADKQIDCCDRSVSQFPVAEMWTFGVVVDEPVIKIVLQYLDAVVEGLANLEAEELVKDSAVEAHDEAIGFGRLDLRPAMFDAIELDIELTGMRIGAAELATIVRQNRLCRKIAFLVEG